MAQVMVSVLALSMEQDQELAQAVAVEQVALAEVVELAQEQALETVLGMVRPLAQWLSQEMAQKGLQKAQESLSRSVWVLG